MEVSWVSILEIHYSPQGDPTHRFGKVKQCDPRETRTPDLALPVPCTNQLCYRANGLAKLIDICWSSTEALTSNWSLCFSFSNLWDGPRYFYGNLRCEYLACAVSSIWWHSDWISLGMRCWNVHLGCGGFVSKYFRNPLLSSGRSDTSIWKGQTMWPEGDSNSRPGISVATH